MAGVEKQGIFENFDEEFTRKRGKNSGAGLPAGLPPWVSLVLFAVGIVIIVFFSRGLIHDKDHEIQPSETHTAEIAQLVTYPSEMIATVPTLSPLLTISPSAEAASTTALDVFMTEQPEVTVPLITETPRGQEIQSTAPSLAPTTAPSVSPEVILGSVTVQSVQTSVNHDLPVAATESVLVPEEQSPFPTLGEESSATVTATLFATAEPVVAQSTAIQSAQNEQPIIFSTEIPVAINGQSGNTIPIVTQPIAPTATATPEKKQNIFQTVYHFFAPEKKDDEPVGEPLSSPAVILPTEIMPTQSAQPEPNLNFFQRFVYQINPDWITIPTAVPTTEPTSTPVATLAIMPTLTAVKEEIANGASITVEPSVAVPDEAETSAPTEEKSVTVEKPAIVGTKIVPITNLSSPVVPLAAPLIAATDTPLPDAEKPSIQVPEIPTETSERIVTAPTMLETNAPTIVTLEVILTNTPMSTIEELFPTVTIPPVSTATITPIPTATFTPVPKNLAQKFVEFLFPKSSVTPTFTPMPTETAAVLPSATFAPISILSTIAAAAPIAQPSVAAEFLPTMEGKAIAATATRFIPVRESATTPESHPKNEAGLSSPVENDEPVYFDETDVPEDEPVLETNEAPSGTSPALSATHTPALTLTLKVGEPTKAAITAEPSAVLVTKTPLYQPTRLPETGLADHWNIPMMILVAMALTALILTVRILRYKSK